MLGLFHYVVDYSFPENSFEGLRQVAVRHTFGVVDVVWESFGVALQWANMRFVLTLVVDVCEEGRWVVLDCLGCFLLCVVILFPVSSLANGCFNSVELCSGWPQSCVAGHTPSPHSFLMYLGLPFFCWA